MRNNPQTKLKDCKNPDCTKQFVQYSSLQQYCSGCEYDRKKAKQSDKSKTPLKRTPIKKSTKPINKVSAKRKSEIPVYNQLRKDFLNDPKNEICFIAGCNRRANTIEHIKGRKGYADDWARENKITLYIDVRFFKPCCDHHNRELENNAELSHQYQKSKIHGGGKGDMK